MGSQLHVWPHAPTLTRLALALAIGLLIGIERERRQKNAGVRTFAFAAILGAVGSLLGDAYALLAMGLLGVLIVLLNADAMRTGEGAEITTSAALIVTGFAGLLAGHGHTFTPTVLGVITAGLLAWKEPLAGFSHALTESEIRSAILLAILAFVVYPVLPTGALDPWGLIAPRMAWVTVILIATLGFANYVLLKLYGARGLEVTGFLGGLVNSTVTVTELANWARASGGQLSDAAFRGVVLATLAMLVRNVVILGLLAPDVLMVTAVPLALMLGGAVAAVLVTGPRASGVSALDPVPASSIRQMLASMKSPFSLTSALKFGAILVALQVAGTLAQGALGHVGFYAVSAIGGAVSSASATAVAANLVETSTLSPEVAGVGAILASLVSALVNLPIVARFAADRRLTRRLALALAGIVLLGAVGATVQASSSGSLPPIIRAPGAPPH